jgi:hypothetical protein
MNAADERHGDAALRRDTLATLRAMTDALLTGRVKRWQLACVAPSLAQCARVLVEPSRAPQDRNNEGRTGK